MKNGCVTERFEGVTVERVLYPRGSGRLSMRPSVTGGRPITDAEAIELRTVVFGSAATPPRGEWVRTGLVFVPHNQEHSYGLRGPRNATRGLITVLQANLLKHFLFDKRPKDKTVPVELLLRPSEQQQTEGLWTVISDIIWNVGERTQCRVALPGEVSFFPHSHTYFQDGITEKLNIYEFKNSEDLQIFIKRYLYLFQEDPGPGALLVLYAAVLTRTPAKIRTDLDAPKGAHLVGPHEEGSLGIVTLLLAGRSTPYLHNGVVYIGDEDHYALPQFGILARSTIGLLMWEGGDSGPPVGHRQPGSRLKTPALPVWVSSCQGHYGVMFNTNRELLRNYHAERRFELQYYTSGGCHVTFNVDTRSQEDGEGSSDRVDTVATPLERLIFTKWQDAKITWTGPAMYI